MIPTGKPTSIVPKGLLLASSGSGTAKATRATKPILQEFAVFSFGSKRFWRECHFSKSTVAKSQVVGEPINESRVVGEPIVIQDRQFRFLEKKNHFLGNENLFPRIVGNENSFPTYSIVTRPRVPPSQSCRNLRFSGISSGTPPIYHILEKCTATFSSYLSLKRSPIFGASAQRIFRPSYTAVVAPTATCES